MLARKSAGGTLLDTVMAFIEYMIFIIIFIKIILLLLFYSIVFYIFFFDWFCFWKGIMKWWVSLLVCAWGLVFKVRNSKVGLNLRDDFRCFEGGFINNTFGYECGSDDRIFFFFFFSYVFFSFYMFLYCWGGERWFVI